MGLFDECSRLVWIVVYLIDLLAVGRVTKMEHFSIFFFIKYSVDDNFEYIHIRVFLCAPYENLQKFIVFLY